MKLNINGVLGVLLLLTGCGGGGSFVSSFQVAVPSFTTIQTRRKRTTTTTTTTTLSPLFLPFNQKYQTLSFPSQTTTTTTTNQKSSPLYSLKHLIDEVISNTETSNSSSSSKNSIRTIFVGGKGGVGKTTISSSLAVTLSSNYSTDIRVLVVSTDPAHSLGDALDVDLRSSEGEPVLMTDALTGGKLYAAEVDPTAALDEFRANLEAFDVTKLASALGVSEDLLEGLGLREFSSLLNNPPPGLDELVALANVLDNDDLVKNEFDVVIVDTAPTGHTLRMLALPQFLDGFLGKLIELRMKLSGLASTLQSLFGSTEASARAATIDNALSKLEQFRLKMSSLKQRLQDSTKTSFVVVTVPTKLGVAESKRLMVELESQGVDVTDLVVNQCVGNVGVDGDGDNSEALTNYYNRRKSGQQKWISEIQQACGEVSSTIEYQENGNTGPIVVTQVPFFDVELVGVPALAYLGKTMYSENENFDYLLGNDDGEDSKFIICGGKGGVGKTTTSSSLAVAMAAAGHNVAIVSTDPAHSLGDALDVDLKGGSLVDCPLIGVHPPSEGSLSAMEIDPSAALSQFKGIVDQLIGTKSKGGDGSTSSVGGVDLGNALRDLGEVFDTLPAGTDEVVALAKVIGLIKKGDFDRVVLDTAPTGHTLRMLSTPAFLSDLIERVLVIARKVNSNAAVKMFINSAAGGGEDLDAAGEAAKSALLSFQVQMYELEDLFANVKQTEFLIVTVPTELAVRESIRLINDLTFEDPDMPIKVRNVVANQVLSDEDDDVKNFLQRVSDGQSASIRDLKMTTESMSKRPEITEVPYLDTEPRGVFGLKALSEELVRDNCASAL